MQDFYYYRPKTRPLSKRDEIISEKALELANLVGAALVFGQFMAENPFKWIAFILGSGFLFVFYCYAWYYLAKRN